MEILMDVDTSFENYSCEGERINRELGKEMWG